jgi:hypothetical protein
MLPDWGLDFGRRIGVDPTMSLSELFEDCSRRAAEVFRRCGALHAMVWVTEDMAGAREAFDMPCAAPAEVDDATALAALCAEMRDDFSHGGTRAYAVAFVGPVTFVGVGCALLAQPPTVRRHVVVVEAHDGCASLIGTREIVPGDRRLGPLQRHERATGRFGGLVAAARETAARDV